jgi:6-phosphogluconate dehydrogenase
MSADIAVVGLAVMGQNLILNMNDHGFVVSLEKLLCF